MLRVGTKLDIFVTAVESEENRLLIWAQTDFEAWQELEKSLEYFCGDQRETDVEKIKPGDVYLAKYQEEDVWYRARVVSVSANAAEITVNFIDFGNNEVVRASDIAVAPRDLFEMPPQAQKFMLGDFEPNDGRRFSNEQIDYLKSNLQNVQCTCKVIRESSAGWPPCIQLFDNENHSLLIDKFVLVGIGRRVPTPQLSLMIPNQVLNVGETYEVFVSHPKSPVQFWVQLVHNQKDLVMLQEMLVDSQQASSVMAGQVCVARHKGVYQRAVVTAVNCENKSCSVEFVDYGNSETVQLMSVLCLEDHLARIPAQAVPCCLTGENAVKNNLNDATDLGICYMKIQAVLKSGVHIVKFSSAHETDFRLRPSLGSSQFRLPSSRWIGTADYKPLQLDISKPLNVCISHVGKMGEFSCQLLSNCHILDSLMVQLQNLKHSPVSNLMSGMACLVRSTKDGIYYRGLVRDFSLQQVLVDLVDFGDVEVTSHKHVFQLPERFITLPQQSFTCILTKSSNDAVIPLLHSYEGCCSLIAVVLQCHNDVNEVELIDTSSETDVKLSEVVNASVLHVNQSRKHLAKPVAKVLPVQLSIPEADVTVGSDEHLYITTVISGSEFFGQLSKYSQDELVEFQSNLMKFYSQQAVPALTNPQIGDICCTKYSEDGLYYRGLVTQCAEKLDILFIDYGNSELKPRHEVKELHPEFCHLPVQGIMCHLSHDCARLSKADMEKCILDREIVVSVLKSVQNGYEVKICGSALQNSGTSSKLRKITVPVGTCENVVVVHTQDPGHFYCQLIRSQEALNSLMAKLEDYSKSQSGAGNYKPEIGASVIAQYTADDEWYRAVVTGAMANGDLEVHFVDYGNHEVLNTNRIIPILPEFLELPCQAICCSLAGVSCKVGVIWPQEATIFFKSLVEDVDLVMDVKENSTNDHKVELYLNDECINWKFAKLAACFVRRTSQSQKHNLTVESTNNAVNDNSSGNTWAKGFERSQTRLSSESSHSSQDGAREFAASTKQKPFRSRARDGQERGRVGKQRNFGEDTKARQMFDHGFGGLRSRRTDETTDKGLSRDSHSSFGSHWQHDDRGMERGGGGIEDRRSFGRTRCRDEGVKRPILSRKELSPKGADQVQRVLPNGAGDHHLPVPALPKLPLREGQIIDVFVSYVVSPSQFWCQPKNSAEELMSLMQEVATEYGMLGPNDLLNKHPSTLQICCAKYSEDGVWYRAKITSCGQEHVTVYFVDYGNSEDVTKSDIKFLKESYLKLPFQAFPCALASVQPVDSDWSPESIICFQELTLEKALSAVIMEKQADRYLIELTDQSVQIHEQLIKAGLAKKVEYLEGVISRTALQRPSSGSSQASTSSRESQQDMQQVKQLAWQKNKHVDVNVVLTYSPSEFWCQLTENTSKIQELMDSIDAKYNNLGDLKPKISQAESGQICCAKYSEDGQWYRAVIKESKPRKVKVSFIDYGNEEWVEESDILELESSFVSLPAQAVKCTLYDVDPVGESWSEEATALFESLAAERNLVAKLISRSGSLHQIKLIDPEGTGDIGEELVRKGFAIHPLAKCFKKQEIKLGSSHMVLPSWVCNSQNFYVHLDSNSSVLLALTDEMFEFYHKLKMNDLAIQDPHVGKVCVAYHADDGNWFRSTILKLLSNEVIVLYVDFGTKAKVPLSKVKEITTTFLELPVQAIQCWLSGLNAADDDWSEEAKNSFRNVMQTRLDCKFLAEKDGVFEVELRDKVGVSVVESINSICQVKEAQEHRDSLADRHPRMQNKEVNFVGYPPRTYPEGDVEVYISNIISPTSFSVQLASEVDDLELFSELVNCKPKSSLQNISVGAPCLAKSSADGAWYRAEISEIHGNQVVVFFVDYGDSDSIPVAELGNVTNALLQKMPFSIRCRLAGVQEPDGEWSLSEVERFEELTVDKKLVASFKKTGSVCEVMLRDGEVNLSEGFLHQTMAKDVIPQFPRALIPAGSASVYISQVDSPNAFYVNLATQSSELEAVVQELEEFTGDIPVNNPSPGYACAAVFSDDNLWYRASVKCSSPSGTGYEVHFVDYGNSSIVEGGKIAALPKHLLSVPVLAIQCSLDGVDQPTSGWPEVAARRLLELGDDGAKELTASFLTATEPCKVKLTVDEIDINQEIRSLIEVDNVMSDKSPNGDVLDTRDILLLRPPPLGVGKHQVMVIHIESLGEFYMQLARDNVEVEQLVDAVDTKYGCMNDDQLKLDDVKLGMLCCAKFSGNDLWHRAYVCARKDDAFEVYFLDFGNKDVVPRSSLKQLSESFSHIPPRLYKCCLHGMSDSVITTDELYDKFLHLTESKIITAEVKCASDETEVIPVVLWDKDECINMAVLGELYENEATVSVSSEQTQDSGKPEQADSEEHHDGLFQAEKSHSDDRLHGDRKEGDLDKLQPSEHKKELPDRLHEDDRSGNKLSTSSELGCDHLAVQDIVDNVVDGKSLDITQNSQPLDQETTSESSGQPEAVQSHIISGLACQDNDRSVTESSSVHQDDQNINEEKKFSVDNQKKQHLERKHSNEAIDYSGSLDFKDGDRRMIEGKVFERALTTGTEATSNKSDKTAEAQSLDQDAESSCLTEVNIAESLSSVHQSSEHLNEDKRFISEDNTTDNNLPAPANSSQSKNGVDRISKELQEDVAETVDVGLSFEKNDNNIISDTEKLSCSPEMKKDATNIASVTSDAKLADKQVSEGTTSETNCANTSTNADQTEFNLSALETFGILHDSEPKVHYVDSGAEESDYDTEDDGNEARIIKDVEQDESADPDEPQKSLHATDICDNDENQPENVPEETRFASSVGDCILAVGQHYDVFLSHVEDPYHVWCQIEAEGFADIMEAMAEYYSQHDIRSDKKWSDGDLCCVLATEDFDERCYRAKILSCSDEEASVQYLDVGKTERVKFDNIRPLIDRFGEADRLAVECSLHGIKPVTDSWTNEATEVLIAESECPLVMQVIDVASGHLPQVSLSSRNGSSLSDILVTKSLAVRTADKA